MRRGWPGHLLDFLRQSVQRLWGEFEGAALFVLLHADDQGAAVDGERGQVARQLLVVALAVRGLLQVQVMAFLKQAALDGGPEVGFVLRHPPGVVGGKVDRCHCAVPLPVVHGQTWALGPVFKGS